MTDIRKEREIVDRLVDVIIDGMEQLVPLISEYIDIAETNINRDIKEHEKKCESIVNEECKAIVNGVYLPEDVIAKELSSRIRDIISNSDEGEEFLIKIEVYANGEKVEPGSY